MRIGILADRVGWEERQILAAADRRGLTAFWIDDGDLCAGPRAERVPPADLYLMRNHSYPRCVVLAGLLADRGERTVNTVEAISMCQDKLSTARALHSAGLPVPDFRVVLTRGDLERALDELGLPCVIKPLMGGLGRRVTLIRDRDLAGAAYDYVEHFAQGFDRVLLAQRYLPGADERVLVVGSTVVAAYRRQPQGDWRANVATGAATVAIDVDAEVLGLVAGTTKVTGADVYALDLLLDADGTRYINEVNHVPMFRGAVSATGVDVGAAFVEHLADLPEAWSALSGRDR